MEHQLENTENEHSIESQEVQAKAEEANDSHNRTYDQIADTSEQRANIPLALILGLLVSIVGATLWALITVLTHYQIGYMAIAIGFIVGFTVRLAGKGSHITFGIIGAVLSLFGCLLGNYLSIIGFASSNMGLGFFESFTSLSPGFVIDMMKQDFQFIDLLFYGIAVYEGFKFSLVG